MRTPQLAHHILEAALGGLERRKQKLDGQIAEIRGMLRGAVSAPAAEVSEAPVRRKRRRLSAAARKRMSDAQRKRWSDSKAAAAAPAAKRPAARKKAAKVAASTTAATS